MKLDDQLKRELRPSCIDDWSPQVPLTNLAAKVLENEELRHAAAIAGVVGKMNVARFTRRLKSCWKAGRRGKSA